MIFHAARVAPEERSHRPPADVFSAVVEGDDVATKMTYGEQLKHPNWQRKRLEVLEAAGWQCERCSTKDVTLHVHHKQYIKGRQAWDYPAENFESLCEDCHKEAHEDKAFIDGVLAQFPSSMWRSIAALIVGYGKDYLDESLSHGLPRDQIYAGWLASLLMNLKTDEILEVHDYFSSDGPQEFLEAIRIADARNREGE